IEYAIAKELLKRGVDPRDVPAWFSEHRLPRHLEEGAKRKSWDWTINLVNRAHQSVLEEPTSTSSFLVEETLHQPRVYNRADGVLLLRHLEVHGASRHSQLWRSIRAESRCSERAAKTAIKTAVEHGYAENNDGLYGITKTGREALNPRGWRRGISGAQFAAYV